MKQTERASIFRVVSDLIKADAIIDTREMEKLDSIRDKYAIKKKRTRYLVLLTHYLKRYIPYWILQSSCNMN